MTTTDLPAPSTVPMSGSETVPAAVPAAVPGSVPGATWSGTLDALEADVARLERSVGDGAAEVDLSADGPVWAPPVGLGPLPEDLRMRAAHLLDRQLAVAEALVEQITKSKQQRDVAARMSQAPGRPAAAFIDRGL